MLCDLIVKSQWLDATCIAQILIMDFILVGITLIRMKLDTMKCIRNMSFILKRIIAAPFYCFTAIVCSLIFDWGHEDTKTFLNGELLFLLQH